MKITLKQPSIKYFQQVRELILLGYPSPWWDKGSKKWEWRGMSGSLPLPTSPGLFSFCHSVTPRTACILVTLGRFRKYPCLVPFQRSTSESLGGRAQTAVYCRTFQVILSVHWEWENTGLCGLWNAVQFSRCLLN